MIEDADSDARLFALAVEETHLDIVVQTVTDGRAAVEYLSGRGIYAQNRDISSPDVIVLDLLLPTTPGTDFLAWCRTSDFCKHLPRVILTGTQENDRELQRALDLGADRAYIKPSGINELVGIVREIYALGMECKAGHSKGHEATH